MDLGMTLNVVTISGSLRKASYNSALQRALPELAPVGMTLAPAPSYAGFPLYNADLQAEAGFPADVTAFANAIRSADGVIIVAPEYNYLVPGALKNALDWVSRLEQQPFRDKPVAIQSATGGPLGGDAVSSALDYGFPERLHVQHTRDLCRHGAHHVRPSGAKGRKHAQVRWPAARGFRKVYHASGQFKVLGSRGVTNRIGEKPLLNCHS
jgi:putative NADPH-quinone reductase